MKVSALAVLAAFAVPTGAEIYLKEQFNDKVRGRILCPLVVQNQIGWLRLVVHTAINGALVYLAVKILGLSSSTNVFFVPRCPGYSLINRCAQCTRRCSGLQTTNADRDGTRDGRSQPNGSPKLRWENGNTRRENGTPT
jgi:hypothetical protein